MSSKTLWVFFYFGSEDIGKFIEDGGFQAWSMSQLSWSSRDFTFDVTRFDNPEDEDDDDAAKDTPKKNHGENPFIKAHIGCKIARFSGVSITRPLVVSMWDYI